MLHVLEHGRALPPRRPAPTGAGPDVREMEEAPSHRKAMQAQLPIRDWGGFYTMASGGLGYGLPAAVGVSLASPGRRVVYLIGDGSMMYSVQALWTAVQHALPLTVVVINNGGYGAMRAFSRVLGVENAPGTELPGLDFVQLARGMGCDAVRVMDPGDVEAALARGLGARGPTLIEVAVDAAVVPDLYRKPWGTDQEARVSVAPVPVGKSAGIAAGTGGGR